MQFLTLQKVWVRFPRLDPRMARKSSLVDNPTRRAGAPESVGRRGGLSRRMKVGRVVSPS